MVDSVLLQIYQLLITVELLRKSYVTNLSITDLIVETYKPPLNLRCVLKINDKNVKNWNFEVLQIYHKTFLDNFEKL